LRQASPSALQIAGAIVVIVYDPKGRVVYTQQISPKLIRLSKLIDELEDFFIDLTMDSGA